MKLLIGAAFILLGVGVVVYAFHLVRIFGHIGWVERRLGPGSSYFAVRMTGVALIFMGFATLRFG
jgi:hypothetical protein